MRVKHLSNGVCISESDFINNKAIQDYRLKQYKCGSIIFQKSGESTKLGRVNIFPFDAYVVNHLAIIDKSCNKNLEFIYFNMKMLYEELIEELSGTTLPYLRISDIKNKFILLPPSNILQKFQSLTEPLFQKIILNQKQIILLRKVRDTLLPLLVFGRLRVEEI